MDGWGGWSAPFEFRRDKLRVRTDFFTRPPRIPADEIPRLWREHAKQDIPFLNATVLAEMKKTNRERDYAVIGELARRMPRLEDQVLHSRSARDLIRIYEQNPELLERLSHRRPILQHASKGRDCLAVELDAERRALIRSNEARLEAYDKAAARWYSMWPQISDEIAPLPLMDAHRVVVERAEGVLPTAVTVPQTEQGGRDAG